MRRRGTMEIGEFIGVVLALMAIGIFLFFAIRYVMNISAEQDSESATNLLNKLSANIDSIKGESGHVRISVQTFKGAENWWLVGWSPKDEGRPDKCYFQSCICICRLGTDLENAKATCQASGICKPVNASMIVLWPPLDGTPVSNSGLIYFHCRPGQLKPNNPAPLVALDISKSGGVLTITDTLRVNANCKTRLDTIIDAAKEGASWAGGKFLDLFSGPPGADSSATSIVPEPGAI